MYPTTPTPLLRSIFLTFFVLVVQGALDSTRIVQKHQSALNLANQSMHAAFDGWATVETNPTSNYLNAKSLEANTCSMKLRDEEKVPILVSKLTSTLADRVTPPTHRLSHTPHSPTHSLSIPSPLR
jgi:hypothetical protein